MDKKLALSYNLKTGKMARYAKSNRKLRWIVKVIAITEEGETSLEFRPTKPVRITNLSELINEEINKDEDIYSADTVIVEVYLPKRKS